MTTHACGAKSASGLFICNKPQHRGVLEHAVLRKLGGQTVAVATWSDEVPVTEPDARTMADPPPFKPPTGTGELTLWWMKLAEAEIDRTVPKAIEYGSTDLSDLGTILARLAGRLVISEQEAAELGIYFYVEGKLARWRDAILNGRQVSDDTLFDIGVYIRMAQRVRSHGGWPGLEDAQ